MSWPTYAEEIGWCRWWRKLLRSAYRCNPLVWLACVPIEVSIRVTVNFTHQD